MEIIVNLTHILVSTIAYWQHLDIACPQQLLMNGVINLNTLQETTKVRAMVIVVKSLPSFFTYAKILAFDPYVVNKSFICITCHGL
jgi:hypothetical protein